MPPKRGRSMAWCLADLSFLVKFPANLRRSENKTARYFPKTGVVAFCQMAHFLRQFIVRKMNGICPRRKKTGMQGKRHSAQLL
jgi:hypothetical protein